MALLAAVPWSRFSIFVLEQGMEKCIDHAGSLAVKGSSTQLILAVSLWDVESATESSCVLHTGRPLRLW